MVFVLAQDQINHKCKLLVHGNFLGNKPGCVDVSFWVRSEKKKGKYVIILKNMTTPLQNSFLRFSKNAATGIGGGMIHGCGMGTHDVVYSQKFYIQENEVQKESFGESGNSISRQSLTQAHFTKRGSFIPAVSCHWNLLFF